MLEILKEIDDWFAENKFSQNTQDRYHRAITDLIHDGMDPKDLRPASFKKWLDSKDWGSSARWVAYCAVRGFVRWKYGDRHPAMKLKIKRVDNAPKRSLKADQLAQLMGIFDTMTPLGIRDLAMCSLMVDTGLRASEVCRLEVSYLDLSERHLDVIVKGGDWGEAVFSTYTALYLSSWLSVREKIALSGVATVFVAVKGSRPGRPLTREGLGSIVEDWGLRSGLGKLSPHDFRRAFAGVATRRGAPSRIVQKAGRWSKIEMVERYTRDIEASDFDPYFPVSGVMER